MENKLQKINEQAAVNASKALSKLIDRQVEVKILRTEVKKVETFISLIGPEELVAGIYLPVAGDLNGAALLIFPKDTALVLSDLLVRRMPGTTCKLTEMDKLSLMELGNIVSGNYLTVLANFLQIKVIEYVPNFSLDMFGAIVSQILTNSAQRTEKALIIEVQFSFKPETLKGYFLLLFEVEQLKAMLGSLVEVVGKV